MARLYAASGLRVNVSAKIQFDFLFSCNRRFKVAPPATSSAEEVPRNLDFLFSRNRLNVAVSRAMCLACIVASPRLLESRARTIEQMRLINALCRFAEMAGEPGRRP